MKFKIALFFFSLFLTSFSGIAQEAFQVNVFVDADRNIYLEDQKLKFNQISTKVKELLYNQPALKYDSIIYDIYGDKNLDHGFIMDVNREMLEGYQSGNITTRKYC